MIYLLSIKNFKALVPLQLGVKIKQTTYIVLPLYVTNYFSKYILNMLDSVLMTL